MNIDPAMVRNPPTYRPRGFTLMELLIVIAIIAILAGMIVALVGVTGDKKALSTTRAEIERISTAIEGYKLKIGVYPPSPSPVTFPNTDPTNTSLFYELTSAELFLPAQYTNRQFQVGITQSELYAACGVGRIFNSTKLDPGGDIEDRKVRAYSFIQTATPRQTNTIEFRGQNIIVFVAPAEGPNGRKVNPLYYLAGADAIHNPGSFDLWAVIKTKQGATVVGNWKD